MGLPVVTVASGGLSVNDQTSGSKVGMAVTEATYGIAVTKVASGGLGVVYVTATGGVVASFATFNGTPSTSFITLSNGNLTVTKNTTTNSGQVSSTAFKNSGKYYFEARLDQKSTGTGHAIGVALTTDSSGTISFCVAPATATSVYSNGVDQGINLGTAATGDVYGFAIDLGGKLGWIRKGSGSWNANGSANPATGVGGFTLVAGSFAPTVYLSTNGMNDAVTGNFGQSAFAFTAPSGFGNWPAS